MSRMRARARNFCIKAAEARDFSLNLIAQLEI